MAQKSKKFGEREPVFVSHPVHPKVKARLMDEGFKLVDAIFAEEGAEVVDGWPEGVDDEEAVLEPENEVKKPATKPKAATPKAS